MFLKDMGTRPSPRHSIERKNVNGNYTPKNCVWATTKEQARNRRDTLFVYWKGKRVKLMNLVDDLGLSASHVRSRLRIGWTIEEAIARPINFHAS